MARSQTTEKEGDWLLPWVATVTVLVIVISRHRREEQKVTYNQGMGDLQDNTASGYHLRLNRSIVLQY